MAETLLVTGGAGYVGSHCVASLIEAGHHVTVVDNLSSGYREAVTLPAELYEIDLADKEGLRRLLSTRRFDAVLNISTLEERWEAIEECERLFVDTRLRVSTDNVGLARVADGSELVRIGEPLRPELAAWRYGDQFGRRLRRTVVYSGLAIAAGAGLALAGPIMGGVAGLSWAGYNLGNTALDTYQKRRVRARLIVPGRDLRAALSQMRVALASRSVSTRSSRLPNTDWVARASLPVSASGR